MPTRCFWRHCLAGAMVWLCLLALTGPALAQSGGQGIPEPTPGQRGKDVLWLPTEQALVDQMLALARVTPADYLIDLGSGDGRIVIAAARLGVRSLGIEYESNLVEVARRNAARAGVADLARFVQGDIFREDFSQATVLTLFLLPSLNLKLRPQILAMPPGTRIVSNTFSMADWQPDRWTSLTPETGCDNGHCDVLLWIVPAKVGGRWKLPVGELQLTQKFQFLTGTFRNGKWRRPISEGRIEGKQIRFRIGDVLYRGELIGNTLQGTMTGGKNGEWLARQWDR